MTVPAPPALLGALDVDTVTDLIGLPLAAALIGVLVAVDLRRELGRSHNGHLLVTAAALAVALTTVVVVRIVEVTA